MFLKISKTDFKIIILFCCLFFAAFAVLFFDLFSNSRNISKQPVIAQTIQISNDVRIKPKEQFDWSPSLKNSPIRYGDQIFTGDKSQTTIKLVDGQKLKISESTIIQ